MPDNNKHHLQDNTRKQASAVGQCSANEINITALYSVNVKMYLYMAS